MSTPRRCFSTGQKTTILKRYFVDKTPMSDLCDEYGIKPNQIYIWQKILFDHAESAFHQAGHRQAKKLSTQEEEIARLRTNRCDNDGGPSLYVCHVCSCGSGPDRHRC